MICKINKRYMFTDVETGNKLASQLLFHISTLAGICVSDVVLLIKWPDLLLFKNQTL